MFQHLKFLMNCTLLNNNTKIIQKKHYGVIIKYYRVQILIFHLNKQLQFTKNQITDC